MWSLLSEEAANVLNHSKEITLKRTLKGQWICYHRYRKGAPESGIKAADLQATSMRKQVARLWTEEA